MRVSAALAEMHDIAVVLPEPLLLVPTLSNHPYLLDCESLFYTHSRPPQTPFLMPTNHSHNSYIVESEVSISISWEYYTVSLPTDMPLMM